MNHGKVVWSLIVFCRKKTLENQTHLLSGKADAGASGCAACQKRRATRTSNRLASTAVTSKAEAWSTSRVSPSAYIHASLIPMQAPTISSRNSNYNTN